MHSQSRHRDFRKEKRSETAFHLQVFYILTVSIALHSANITETAAPYNKFSLKF